MGHHHTFRKFRDIISEFLYLKVVSLGTTGFLLSISILVMIFDAMSIISIMPLIDFIRLDQDIEIYVSETKYAEKLVNYYYFFNIPFNLFSLSLMILVLVLVQH